MPATIFLARIIVVLLLAAAAGCAGIEPPEGYIKDSDQRRYDAKYWSARGNVIAHTSRPNEDRNASLQFWSDAVESLRPGGLALLFGGCAPGTRVELDTHRLHYSEITVKGAYHHRPATVRRALALLEDEGFGARHLLSGVRPIEEVEQALRAMMEKRALKVVIRAGG